MKNKTVLYLAKGEKESSALLKSRAVEDYFGNNARLSVSEKGKPLIAQPDGYGISVSHSDGIVAIVIAPFNVGIDIQKRTERDNTRLLSFFEEGERDSDFYNLWVKKEAWGKVTGDGVFVQKGKKLPSDAQFTDISQEVSDFAQSSFSAVICGGHNIEIKTVFL